MVRSVTPGGRVSGEGPPAGGWFRLAAAAAVLMPAGVLVAWLAVHRISGFGPWVADTLRSLIGIDGVARLEEFVYGIEDQVNSVLKRGEAPKAYWEVPPEVAESEPATEPVADAADEPDPAPELPAFRPPSVGPVHIGWAAPGDGQWVPLPEDVPAREARMFKTLLHPDKSRSWAELFVVAIDLRRVTLHLVPGTREPVATLKEGMELSRPGRVPDEHHAGVLAAFNGGFKTEHGHYGMHVDGVTLVPPHANTCTVAYFKDHSLQIGSWQRVSGLLDEAQWWRQTPNCMFEDGTMHPRLASGYVHKWGATLDKQTVIRRSAIGLDATGRTLYVGISNHTTAPAIAEGMHHAGAVHVAQLDVNFSYPKFVTFRPSRISKLRFAVPLANGFEFSEHEYLRKPSHRDFFYIMEGAADGRTARK